MSAAIARVQEFKVTTEKPPREDIDGLDYQRCAELHNAIVEHGWTRSGRPLEAMPSTTWWDMQIDNPRRDATISLLHPSVVEFLKRAYQFDEKDFNFFHYLTALQGAGDISMTFKENLDDPDHRNRFYTLYSTDQTHTMNPDGLIYDQEKHMCLLGLHTDDPSQDQDNPWQKLESVLTVYIELIETGKVVAVHKDLEFPDDAAWYDAPDPALSGLRFARDRPGAMLVDPVSGYAKKQGIVYPWMCVSSTETDVSETLKAWEVLVKAIHERIGGEDLDVEPVYGLANDQHLETLPDGFAKKLLAAALKPRFKYIAPGLRVQTLEELLDQPYAECYVKSETQIPPLLILRGEQMADPRIPFGFHPYRSVPAGLYLEPCDKFWDAAPWEDGAMLILPYYVGNRGSWARMADQKPLPFSNDLLYSIGWNPFIAPHPTQLVSILTLWYRNLMSGAWEVDEEGVKGGIEKYREADTEEHCMEYVVDFWC